MNARLLSSFTATALCAAATFTSMGAGPQGETLAWGKYIHYLGDSKFSTNLLIAPAGLSNVVALGSGLQHVIALRTDGRVQAFGEWSWAQTNVPANLSNVVAIAAGDYHSLALTASGDVFAWGADFNNQSWVSQAATNVAIIAAGGYHSMAFKRSRDFAFWGDNRAGQCNPPGAATNAVALAGGTFHSLALLNNGTVVGWGDNSAGQCNVPAGLANVVAIAAHGYYSLALKSDGTVVGWGTNNYGQISIPASVRNAIAISAGDRHAVALLSNRTVVAWGANDSGQTAVPASAVNVTALSAGGDHTVAALGFAPPRVVLPPASAVITPGATTTLSALAYGTAPLAYQWRMAGTNLPGAIGSSFTICGAAARHTGDYLVVVTNLGGAVTSAVATVTVAGNPPLILDPPVSASALVGGAASFCVSATGTPVLRYQWRLNGGEIAGATATRYALVNAQYSQAGDYSVAVANDYGATTSAPVALTVTEAGVPPSFTVEPGSRSVIIADNTSFTAAAHGTAPLAWQWYFNGHPMAGATRSAHHITNVQPVHAGGYIIVVTNNFGAATSGVATLTTVGLPPTLVSQPQGRTNLTGTLASFSVGVAGTLPMAYQWRFNGANLAGATGTGLTLSNVQTNQSGDYYVFVSNAYGTATSEVASLLVETPGDPPVLLETPSSLTNFVNDPVVFTVSADGSDPLRYQWRHNGADIPGASDPTFTISSAQTNDSGSYVVRVTNRWGAALSPTAVLTVRVRPTPPSFTAEPQSRTVLLGSTPLLSVTVTGTIPISYQWRRNGSDLVDTTHFSGTRSNTLRIVSFGAMDEGAYSVIASNEAGSILSSNAVLTLAPTNTVTATLLAEDAATQGSWKGVYGAFGCVVINNATNLTGGLSVSPANLAAATWAASNNAARALMKATTTDVNDRIAANWYNSTSVVFDVVTDVPRRLSIYCLDWNNLGRQQLVEILGGVSGPVLSSTTVSAFSNGKYVRWDISGPVRVRVSAQSGASAVISGIFFDAAAGQAAPPAITQQPQSRTNLAGSSATFSVTAGGTAPLGYQWRKAGANLAGATASSYSIAAVTSGDAGGFSVVVTNAAGAVTSSVATLTVVFPPAITQQPQSLTNVAGTPASFSVTASGTAPLSYQWRKAGASIPGATSTGYALGSVQPADAAGYSVVVSSAYGSATSSVAVLTVVLPAAIAQQPSGQVVVAGHPASFSVAATGTAPLALQWRKEGVSIPGATSSSYLLPQVTTNDAGGYSAVVSNPYGTDTSAVATLTVVLPPSIVTPPVGQTVVAGEAASFAVVATGTAPLSYQWLKDGVVIAGATQSGYIIGAVATNDAAGYSVAVSNPYGAETSAVAVLSVVLPPSIVTPPAGQTVVVGAPVNFTVLAEGTGPLSYRWLKDGAAMASATNLDFSIAAAQTNDAGGYAVVVTNAYGAATSAVAVLMVELPPNVPPMAVADLLRKPGGGTQTISFAELLANDFDPDGGTFTVVAVTSPTTQAGTATLGVGVITYEPSDATKLWDTFQYTIQDQRGGTAVALVTLQLDATSNGSVAGGATVSPEGQAMLQFNGIPGSSYIIQAADDPSGPWINVSTNTAAADGSFQFSDPASVGQPMRFYRTVSP